MDYILLGKKINQSRNKAGLTQARLAEMVNVTPAYIGQIERGERKFSIETLVSICNALHVSTDFVLRDSLELQTGSMLSEINFMLADKNEKELSLSADILHSILKYLGEK